MKIRRYTGSDTQEAILKVKMDLGNDALILNTKKVRQKGILKLFSKPMVEVLAAVDESKGKPASRPNLVNNTGPVQQKAKETVNTELAKVEEFTKLESRVSNMESVLNKIYEKVNSPINRQNTEIAFKSKENDGYLQNFHNNLIRSGVEPDISRDIIKKASEKLNGESSMTDTATAVYNVIASILGRPEEIRLREDTKPTIVIFVGPTGVGKTTTLAKIAANYTLNHKKDVGLITTDTYRISAVDQLKTYAEIMGIPLAVIYSVDEVKHIIEGYAEKDLILIDTAGRSNRDKQQFDDLNKLVELTKTDEIYLVLSATTSARNISDTVENYSFLKNYKIILTKMDESSASGIILNTKHLAGKPLSYVTNGQSVPDDIELANVSRIIKNLMGSIN